VSLNGAETLLEALGSTKNHASDAQNSRITQTNLEIAGSARFFSSLLGICSEGIDDNIATSLASSKRPGRKVAKSLCKNLDPSPFLPFRLADFVSLLFWDLFYSPLALRVSRLPQARRYHACPRHGHSHHVFCEIYICLIRTYQTTWRARGVHRNGRPRRYRPQARWGGHNTKGFERPPRFYTRTSQRLFASLWRRRLVLLGVTPMIESERGIVFRSRNLDLQNGTRIFSLEKWV